MEPKKINMFHADTGDMDKDEVGEYYPYKILYTKYPARVGDLVILEVYPEFDDPVERHDYIQQKGYPPDFLVLARVSRFTDGGGFFCKVLMDEPQSSAPKTINGETG